MNSDLQDKIQRVGRILAEPGGKELWDVLVCLRGPDSPSERGRTFGLDKANQMAYDARVARKMRTVAVIRGKTFPGIGAARFRQDRNWVELPPSTEWDHFDKHVARAAQALGIEVRIDQPPKPKKGKDYEIEVTMKKDEEKGQEKGQEPLAMFQINSKVALALCPIAKLMGPKKMTELLTEVYAGKSLAPGSAVLEVAQSVPDPDPAIFNTVGFGVFWHSTINCLKYLYSHPYYHVWQDTANMIDLLGEELKKAHGQS